MKVLVSVHTSQRQAEAVLWRQGRVTIYPVWRLPDGDYTVEFISGPVVWCWGVYLLSARP